MSRVEPIKTRHASHATGSQPIAVIGAAGHTGEFVVAELARRDWPVVLAGRDRTRLDAAAHRHAPNSPRHVVDLETPASLDEAVAGAAAVINCAGPFLDTAKPVIDAALRAGIHYVDVTAEQTAAAETLNDYGHAASMKGVVVMPAVGFYGGLADLLATIAMRDWTECDAVEVAVALDSWHPTRGTRLTGERNTMRRVVFTEGKLQDLAPGEPGRTWTFPPPFATQELVAVPLSEIITISRHLPTSAVHSYMNLKPLADLSDPTTQPPVPADDRGRSTQTFCMDVIVGRGGATHRATALGRDIYAVTAPLAVEAATRILGGQARRTGAGALAELLDAHALLDALRADSVQLSEA